MYRVKLDAEQHEHLRRVTRDARQSVKARERAEMLLLSDAGWSPPRIALHFSRHPETIRQLLRVYQQQGNAALTARPPGPAPDHGRRTQVEDALKQLLAQERTWKASELQSALREQGIMLSVGRVRVYLRGFKAGYRRTVNTLDHKQNLAKVEHAEKVLGNLKKS